MNSASAAAERLLPDLDWVLDEAILTAQRLAPVAAAQRRWLLRWERRRAGVLTQDGAIGTAGSLACRQGFVLTRQQALNCGLSAADIRRLGRRGWATPRRGMLSVFRPSDRDDRHALAVAAAVASLRRGVIASGPSAAVMHALPRLTEPAVPTVTAPDPYRAATSTRLDDGARVLHATVSREDQATWFGVPITSAARTVVDLGRLGVADGLVAADAALAGGVVTRGDLAAALDRCRGWPGVRAARRAIELADAKSESPLESITRLCVVDGGLPVPQLQVIIRHGAWWCRVDMLWEAERVVLEADGIGKYRKPADLHAEKRREARLQRLGFEIVRVMWDEVINDPQGLIARIRAKLTLAHRR